MVIKLIGKKLKELRIKKGFTQKEIAEKLNTTQNTYSRWESDTIKPSYIDIVNLANIYNVSTDCILEHNQQVESKLIELDRILNEKQKETIYNVIKSIYPDITKKIDL